MTVTGAAGAQTGTAPGIRCLAQTDAAGIDAMLAGAGSPLAGQGPTFVAEGVAAGIDPRLLLAIAAHETRFATYAPARAIHNPFGLGPGLVFSSDAAAIARAARTLDAYYVQEGRIRIDTIGPKWAPIGAANDPQGLNRHWVAGVGAQYAALGGDPDAPVLIGAQSAPCPAPAGADPDGPAASAAAAPGDRSSGPAEVTTWGGAALMIALVGYLALRRRRVIAAAAAARDARFAWEPADPDADAVAEALATAHAQTAAAATPLGIAAGEDDEIEDAEWTLEEPPASEEDTAEFRVDDAPPEPPLAERAVELPEADPAAAFWAWAEDECAGHDDAEPDEPIDWHPVEEPAPAAPVPVATEPEPEPKPADEAVLADQAGVVADLVPALLEGLLPIERVCDRSGVTPRMLALMRIVADAPLPVTEQARRLGVPRPVVAGLCARIEALGLAQREPLADDARRHAVVLTAAGYELCADGAPAPDPARVEAVLARMTAADRTALLAGLTALASPSAE